MKNGNKLVWIISLAVMLSVMPGLVSAMTADELTKQTGIAGGLCAFPQATAEDVKLALELAKRPTFIVHVMAKEDNQVAAIRAQADAAGVLGRSFYVEKASAAALPFADHLVDLLVISDLKEADLTKELRAECLRVITAVRGVALVGGSSLHTPLPPGADAWTHYLHGPERSQNSMDTALQAPFLTQWWGAPRRDGFWGTTLVACNGRMFTIRSDSLRHKNPFALLTARSMNNGIVLWQRELCPYGANNQNGGFATCRSSAVATEDTLFLIDRDSVLRLDAETGAERGRIMGPKPNGQIKWMAIEGKSLAMMAGDLDHVLTADFFKDMPMTPAVHTKMGQTGNRVVTDTPMGRDLAVYDLANGKTLWRDTVAGDISEYLIAMRDQRLYYPAEGVGMVCRNVQTGQNVWTNPDPELKASFNPTLKLGYTGTITPILSVYKDVLDIRDDSLHYWTVSLKDGALLWKKTLPHAAHNEKSVVWGDTVLSGKNAFSLMTGKETPGPVYIYSGCGVTISTPNYLITCFGRVSEPKSNRLIRLEDNKGPCLNGTIVSDGTMITIPSECACYYELKGYRALVSAGNIKPHTAPSWKDRLAVFDTAEPQPLPITTADWPTYRHDPQRSAGSSATVGEQPRKILWQWKPSGMEPYSKPYVFRNDFRTDFLATAAVAAEGLVWFGAHDGTIRCVKADTGAPVWSFATGGMLFKPPTLWQGRLLAGGGDGNVYCLDARTGKSLWRFQAAPLDRRVFWYGHLINTWPLLAGVVVQDDIAYTVAGYQKGNGVHAYALNPKNGQVLWERDDIGALPNVTMQQGNNSVLNTGFLDYTVTGVVSNHKNEQELAGLDSHGSMAVGENKLWLPGGCLDLKNGEAKGFGVMYGCEVGLLDKWIVQGGRRISETEDTLDQPLKSNELTISALSKDETECKTYTLNRLASTSLPAWDAENVLLPPTAARGGPLTFLPRTKFDAWLTDHLAAAAPAEKAPAVKINAKADSWQDLKLWNSEGVQPVAYALAKDQAVVAFVSTDGKSYHLTGYHRADGKKAWTIDLPEQPAMNRLAIDRNGRVLVSLCDGSVVCVGR